MARPVLHYSLPAILAVGFQVRSTRGTQFRQWATARLTEYLVRGFTMDDERIKNPPGPGHVDYFDELLERVLDIRSSERRLSEGAGQCHQQRSRDATYDAYTPIVPSNSRIWRVVINQ